MRSSTSNAQKSVFSDLIFTVPCALASAHFFMGQKRGRNYFELFLEDGYFIDLLVRSSLAFLTIVLVKLTTGYLDRKRPWAAGIWMRFFLQFYYGFLGVIFIDFVIYTGYLERKGVYLSDGSSFFDLYSLYICVYTTLINIYYNYASIVVLTRALRLRRKQAVAPVFIPEDQLEKIVPEVRKNHIVYIWISKNGNVARNMNHESLFWHYTTEASATKLSGEGFFQVNRQLILHRSVIDNVISEPASNKLELVLKAPFNEQIRIPVERIPGVNKWLQTNREDAAPR